MIYDLALDVHENLQQRKFPISVVYGPEYVPARHVGAQVIIFERDRSRSDVLDMAPGFQRNARKVLARYLAASATFYVKSPLHGAMVHDHENECEAMVDAVLAAFAEWSDRTNTASIEIADARYLSATELASSDRPIQQWAGAVYVLRFNVPRGVMRLDYTGAARPEGAASGVQGQTQARLVGADGDPAIGCGA